MAGNPWFCGSKIICTGTAFEKRISWEVARQKAWDGREPLVLWLKKLDLASLVTVLLPLLPYLSLLEGEQKKIHVSKLIQKVYFSSCRLVRSLLFLSRFKCLLKTQIMIIKGFQIEMKCKSEWNKWKLKETTLEKGNNIFLKKITIFFTGDGRRVSNWKDIIWQAWAAGSLEQGDTRPILPFFGTASLKQETEMKHFLKTERKQKRNSRWKPWTGRH